MTDDTQAAAAEEPAPDPPPPGLDELIAWLQARVPAASRARIAHQVITRIEDEVRDPALRYAWEHRNMQATRRDLATVTGINIARITWALGHHPRNG